MAPPQDFSAAYNSQLSPVRAQPGEREYNNQGQNNGDAGQNQGQVNDEQQGRTNEDNTYLRPDDYTTGQKRKRSFTMPGTFESP
jgi:hypothetical protein